MSGETPKFFKVLTESKDCSKEENLYIRADQVVSFKMHTEKDGSLNVTQVEVKVTSGDVYTITDPGLLTKFGHWQRSLVTRLNNVPNHKFEMVLEE